MRCCFNGLLRSPCHAISFIKDDHLNMQQLKASHILPMGAHTSCVCAKSMCAHIIVHTWAALVLVCTWVRTRRRGDAHARARAGAPVHKRGCGHAHGRMRVPAHPKRAPARHCVPKSYGAPITATSASMVSHSSTKGRLPKVDIPTKGKFNRPLL